MDIFIIYIVLHEVDIYLKKRTATFLFHHERRSQSSALPPATRAAAWSPSAARTSIGALLHSFPPTQSWDVLATASAIVTQVSGRSFEDLGCRFGHWHGSCRPLHGYGCRLLHSPTATPAATATSSTSSSSTATSTATSTMRKIFVFFSWILAPGSCHGLLGW